MRARVSPLTGQEVTVLEDPRRDILYFDDVCGRWSLTAEADFEDASILGGRLDTAIGRLSESETRKVFALARSEVWRLSNAHRKVPLFMTLNGAKRTRQEAPGSNDDTEILAIEELVERSRTLTLEEKALTTLDNLAQAEGELGAGVDIPYLLQEYPGEADWPADQPPREVGVTYGCTASEAAVVYQLLLRRGLIAVQAPRAFGESSRAFVTPEGYAQVRSIREGSADIVQAFFVCRFIPLMDSLFDSVFKPIGAELKCNVQRVKDIHHIDKIDDRICEEIRRSTIVLVDLTEQNFNVAFEAGYALALNKPIVWTKRAGASEPVMPFDIYTYNCLEWDPNNIGEFRDALRFRILAALQKARRSLD